MAFRFSVVNFTLISLSLLSVLFFFLRLPSESPVIPRRFLLDSDCSVASSDGIFNYSSVHFCVFRSNPFLSVPFLTVVLLLQFYILVKTAQDRFSVVVTKLSTHLKLSPSMGAVTLLALGNGAPDVFASVAAVRGGQARTGFGAILSAGTFVSALVVGFVAIHAAPFAVDPAPFVRDVMFYLTAALFLFYVYLSAEIYLWQAVGFVAFYVFFVGVVFWMDLGYGGGGGEKGKRSSGGGGGGELGFVDCEIGDFTERLDVKRRQSSGFWKILEKVSLTWEIPVSTLLNLTIPQTSPSKWNRFYQSANIALCPLALLYSLRSFVPLSHPIIFLVSTTHIPLWLIVFSGSFSLAALHFTLEKDPPKTEQIQVVAVAFIMSVFWISTIAGELLNNLSALGKVLHLPPAILGLTVLAWGNSIGDLVADVAVAKAGQPAMAMAGCFACPMFNMLFGLGMGLVIETAGVYPEAYELRFHTSIVVAFVFLIVSLMGSLLVVTWCMFRVTRVWGFCLVGLYVVFIGVSLIIARFSF